MDKRIVFCLALAAAIAAPSALIGSLASIAALGIIAWLLYQNWELIKDF